MEPRQLAHVLQSPFRRRQQLHVHLRWQLHAGDDASADRDLHCEPARDSRARDVARPGRSAARRRRPDDGAEGDRTEERGGNCLQWTVRVHAAERAGVAGGDARAAGTLERRDPRGARRHLRDFCGCGDPSIPAAGVPGQDPVDLRSGPGRPPRVAGIPGSGRRTRHAVYRRPDDAYPQLPEARARSQQPGERVPAEPDCAAV